MVFFGFLEEFLKLGSKSPPLHLSHIKGALRHMLELKGEFSYSYVKQLHIAFRKTYRIIEHDKDGAKSA